MAEMKNASVDRKRGCGCGFSPEQAESAKCSGNFEGGGGTQTQARFIQRDWINLLYPDWSIFFYPWRLIKRNQPSTTRPPGNAWDLLSLAVDRLCVGRRNSWLTSSKSARKRPQEARKSRLLASASVWHRTSCRTRHTARWHRRLGPVTPVAAAVAAAAATTITAATVVSVKAAAVWTDRTATQTVTAI